MSGALIREDMSSKEFKCTVGLPDAQQLAAEMEDQVLGGRVGELLAQLAKTDQGLELLDLGIDLTNLHLDFVSSNDDV